MILEATNIMAMTMTMTVESNNMPAMSRFLAFYKRYRGSRDLPAADCICYRKLLIFGFCWLKNSKRPINRL